MTNSSKDFPKLNEIPNEILAEVTYHAVSALPDIFILQQVSRAFEHVADFHRPLWSLYMSEADLREAESAEISYTKKFNERGQQLLDFLKLDTTKAASYLSYNGESNKSVAHLTLHHPKLTKLVHTEVLYKLGYHYHTIALFY